MRTTLRLLSMLCITILLASCGYLRPTVTIPDQPLYVVTGERAIPGLDKSAIWLLDRTTFTTTTQRNLPLTFIHDGFIDANHIWLGYAGDLNEDAYMAANLSLDLRHSNTHRACMEPLSIHPFGDDIIVLCQERGFEGKVVRMNAETGKILRESPLITKHGDMMFYTSMLFNGELLVYGCTHTQDYKPNEGCELQIRDPNTLTINSLLKTSNQQILNPAEFLQFDANTLYILNQASAPLESENRPATDLFLYHTGDSELTPLANFGRSPEMGTILDGYLYTVHNIWDSYYLTADTKTRIYKTNLTTWESTYWEYEFYEWRYIGDIEAIDGHVFVTRFGHNDVAQEGIYQLDTDTGELTMRIALPGVSLFLLPKD